MTMDEDLDNGERHVELAAQSGQPDHQLDGIYVVRDQHQLRLLLLHESGDVLKTVLQRGRRGSAGGGRGLFAGGGEGCVLEALRLGCFSLWLVFHKELEDLRSLIFIQRSGELIDCRRNF